MRALALLLLVTLAAALGGDAQRHGIFFWTLKPQDVESLARHVPQDDSIRLAQLKQTFEDMDCKGEYLHEQQFAAGKNLLCTMQGNSKETLLFVAHYEHYGPAKSAIENWSGATMLPFLYHALIAAPRKHTFVFVELDGEAGATSYLQSLTRAERLALKAVVAVDALGLGPLSFYVRPNSFPPSPTELLLQSTLLLAAHDKGIPPPKTEVPGGWFKIDDTRHFRFANIPSILVHSVSRETRDIPGSEKDTLDAIDGDAYFTAYSLLCYYIAELDEMQIGTRETHPSSIPSARGHR
jgi:Peptidase family M28